MKRNNNPITFTRMRTASTAQGYRVLFVDDEVLIRKAFLRSMRRQGVLVDLVEGPYEALEEIDRNRYDVVVTDLTMPKMDGLALIEKIHERCPSIQFVLLTGHSELSESGHYQLAQPKVHVAAKPWDGEKLATLIRILANVTDSEETAPRVAS